MNLIESKNLKTFIIVCLIVFLGMFGIVLMKLPSQQEPVKTDEETVVTQPKSNPPVQYNEERNKKMLQILEDRPALSPSDQTRRAQLTASVNPLSETLEYSLEYLSAPDEFMVEIRTIDINSAKQKAISWFKSKGLSDEGICHLPLVFYLNYDVAQNLRDMKVEFDPLPPGC